MTILSMGNVEALAAAMAQIMDDMRKDGTSVCLATKAQARIAYEPIDEARRILKELS